MRYLSILAFASLCAATLLAQAPPPGGPPGGMQQGDGIWLRNAYFGELETFDSCFGHQPGNGQYHHHVQPICLRAQLDDNVEPITSGRTGTTYREKSGGWKHSPILGWAFDGFPIYGPYGYSDPKNASSPIVRVRSGFRLRKITARDSLPDWALSFHSSVTQQLTAAQRGPAINDQFPLGRYAEDYELVAGIGDLDQHNGRVTVTPEYPNGTYAYYVTIDEDGKPAFPYVFALQYYGAVNGGQARTIPSNAEDYFNNGQFAANQSTRQDALLKSLSTKNSQTAARAVVGWDPSAGPQITWPGTQPAGARTSGSVTTASNADVQRIRTTSDAVYLNSNNLPSYVIGPWFMSANNGGVFLNFPSSQTNQYQLPRSPQAASGAHTAAGLGAVGTWVNGVAAFNVIDGASYRSASNSDVGGGIVEKNAAHFSSASLEGGPVTPGSLVTAFANFEARLATSTEQVGGTNWPVTLGGATVTVKDSAGVSQSATIAYASPRQVNYRVPEGMATGIATVTISAGGVSIPGALNIVPTYPGLFKVNAEGLAAAQVARLRNGQAVYESVSAGSPILLGDASEEVTLVLYGTGLNSAKDVSVMIGGEKAQVAFAGPQGTYAGLDQINVLVPRALAGRGKIDVILTAAGRPSNPVYVVIQ